MKMRSKSPMVIEVFRTNVHTDTAAKGIVLALQKVFPGAEINFDLEDCDNILRIASPKIGVDLSLAIDAVRQQGFLIEVLE